MQQHIRSKKGGYVITKLILHATKIKRFSHITDIKTGNTFDFLVNNH